MRNFSNRSAFLGARRPHLAAGEAASTDGGRECPRLSGPAEPSQAEALQRCFFPRNGPWAKRCPFQWGKNGFKDWLLFLWKMVKNLREKPQNPLLLLKPQKLIKFF